MAIVLKCQSCGKEVDLPFQCSFCRGHFCIEHRLPENHMCIGAPPRTPLRHWNAKKKELPTFSFNSQKPEEKNQKDHVKISWKERPKLKIHAYGLIAGTLALASLILPWWYFQMSTSMLGVSLSTTVTADLNKVMISTTGLGTTILETTYVVESTALDMWFGQIAFNLIVLGGILSIVGGLISGRIGKNILVLAGMLVLVSIIVYAYGLQTELPKLTGELINYPYNLKDFPVIQLFSSGAYSHPDYPVPSWSYSSYLYIGFWADLIATILAFVSVTRH